jgi:hypothetical protein
MKWIIYLFLSIKTLLFLITISGCSSNDNINPKPDNIITLVKELNIGATNELTLREKIDGGFLVAGFSTADGSILNYEAMLSSTSSSGEILWTKYYTLEGFDFTTGGCAVQKSTGEILLSGLSGNVDQPDQSILFLAVIDQTGNWTDHTIYPVKGKVMYHEILVHEDKYRLIFEYMTFDVTGYTTSDTLRVITLNSEGDVLNNHRYANVYCSGQVKPLQDGSLLIPGNTSLENNRDSQLLLINPNGDVNLRVSFGSDSWDQSFSTDLSQEGDYLLSGYQTFSGISTIYRINASEDVEYNTYGDTLHIESNSLRKTDDGGYLFMNYYLNPNHYFSGGNTRIYFSKLNKQLEVEWTSWLDDIYTRDINYHGYLPSELIPTNDGAFAFLFYNNPEGYLLVKTIAFN